MRIECVPRHNTLVCSRSNAIHLVLTVCHSFYPCSIHQASTRVQIVTDYVVPGIYAQQLYTELGWDLRQLP
jgi:hypothetical protein